MQTLAALRVLMAELRRLWEMEGAWARPETRTGEQSLQKVRLDSEFSFSFKLFTFNLVLSSESHYSTFIYLASMSPVDVFLKSSNAFSAWDKWQDSSERP